MIGPIESVASGLKKYAKFSGRATRSEFWWFQLFYWICFYGGHALGDVLHGYYPSVNGNTLGFVVNLALTLPLISVQVRRLHDIGWSGWWLAGFYVSALVVIFIFPLKSSSTSLPILILLLAISILVLLLGVVIIVQYFRGSNAKGDKYGASGDAGHVSVAAGNQRFVPQEYVPQEYVPQGYAPTR